MSHSTQAGSNKTTPQGKATEHSAALTIAITSGKGGVGKTNVTTNLGIALARTGKKVCVFDADTSLANINILLKLNPEYTLEHFLRDNLSIEDIMLTGPEGMQIVPAATGIADFAQLNPEQQNKLIAALEDLERRFDYILIDTAAGIGDSVTQFIQSAQYAVIVVSPEPTSLTDAFSLVKVLKRSGHEQPLYVLVNMTKNYNHSMEVYRRFAHAVNKYVQTKVRYLGYIPTDKAIQQAVLSQTPISIANPDSPASRCISLLASILIKHFNGTNAPVRKISAFWKAQAPSEEIQSLPEQTQPEIQNQSNAGEIGTTLQVDENMSQLEAETLLADLIQFYLVEFGQLPEQAIDLILQAHAQGQLSDENVALLQQQILEEDSAPTSPNSMVKVPIAKQIGAQIDQLVAEAEQSKQELTDLTKHLTQKYRQLYNRDTSPPKPSIRPITKQKEHKNTVTLQKDKESLLQSSLYAAAVDIKLKK